MRYGTSAVSALNLWVEAFEFDAGIQSGELPVHPFWGRVSPLFPLLGFLYKRLHVWDPTIQALHGQDTELNLSDIEPTAVLRGVMDLQTRGQPARLLWREGLIERANPMGIEVITHQPHPHRLWVADLKQVADLMGPVHSRPMLWDMQVPHATQRLREHENVRRPNPLILVVDLPRLPWGSRERRPGLLDQLHGLFIHAYQRDLRIVGLLIDRQDILHMCHKLATVLGRNHPHLLQIRPQRIFLSACLTVSWLIASTMAKATAWSARSRRVQRAWPAGGSLHLSAISLASPSPSKRGGRDGRVCFFRLRAASSPCSTNRGRMPWTGSTLTAKLSAMRSSGQAGPLASGFNRIWACLILYAAAFPFLVNSVKWRRSSSVSRTMYFLCMAHSV